MEIDVNSPAYRNTHEQLHGNDQEFKIFYDETNNIGKLKFREDGLNVQKVDNFVLGGIALHKEQSAGDIKEFRKLTRIQEKSTEIKFKMIAHGQFDKILGSKNLYKTLTWLDERDINIHFTSLNLLNWAILDIVESIVAHDDYKQYIPIHFELKNELYYLATRSLPDFLKLLKKYQYPLIPKDNVKNFVKELYQFLVEKTPEDSTNVMGTLKDLILRARNIDNLIFVTGTPDGEETLIESFHHTVINRICTFRNSEHLFDNELSIQEKLSGITFKNHDKQVAFSFVKSEEHFETQLSDIISGFLGKYFSFVQQTPTMALIDFKNKLTHDQKNNLNLTAKLIMKSHRSSNALIHRTNTQDNNFKDMFLMFNKPLPSYLKHANR